MVWKVAAWSLADLLWVLLALASDWDELIVLDKQGIAPLLEALIVLVAISQSLLWLPTDDTQPSLPMLLVVTTATNTLQVLGRIV